MTHTDLRAFVAKLDQRYLKRSGSGLIARCPAHDDRQQSLSVKEGAGGKLLVHCFAGCAFPDILSAAGVPRSSPTSPPPLALVRNQAGIVAEYDYTDANGALLYQVVRKDPKSFSVRTPRPTGGWIDKLIGDRVLYRLPLVTEAAAEGRRIFIVEGEKDADRLATLGLVATTNQGGAAQPWLPQYTQALAGASVVVLPDNDSAGEKHAQKIAGALHAAGIDVRVCKLPDLPPKGDVSDWLDAGSSVTALEQCVDGTPSWTETESDPLESEPTRFRLYSVAELAQIPEPEPLVEGVLSRATLAMIVAKYASFKSFVALDLALHIAVGLEWYGRAVTPGPVVYVYAEGVRGIARRVEAWRRMNGLPDIGGIYFLPQSLMLNESRDCGDLLAAIGRLPAPPIAVVVDTLARTFKGNESASEDMNTYIAACDRIKETTEATVVLVHHTGWEGTRSRGATNLPGALDTEITLTRDGDRVSIAATKQKDGAEGEIVTLEAVEIAGSLALRRVGPTTPRLSKNERRCLEEVQADGGLTTTAWERAAGIPHSSFHNARKRLLALAYVRCATKKWEATEAGVQALGTTVNGGPTDVQTHPVQFSTNSPSPLGERVVLDLPESSVA